MGLFRCPIPGIAMQTMNRTAHIPALSPRLQAAVVAEVQHSGALIDAGLSLVPRALVLGIERSYRIQFASLAEAPTDRAYLTRLGGAMWGAMLVAAGRAFVLTEPDYESGTFTTYGVSDVAEVGIISMMTRPYDHRVEATAIWPAEAIEHLRSWIPPLPFVYPEEPMALALLSTMYQRGAALELAPVGIPVTAFNMECGHA